MQIFVALARKLQLNGIELKQQVEAESAHQSKPVVFLRAEFVNQRAKDGERGRLFAALFFGEQRWQGLQPPTQSPSLKTKCFPVAVPGKQGIQDLIEHLAAPVQRPEIDIAAGCYDLERWRNRHHIPARITLRILVAGGEINAPIPV